MHDYRFGAGSAILLIVGLMAGACGGGGSSSPSTPNSPSTPSGPTTTTPAPTITAITPTTGPVAGGTAVTITGANFAAGATVTVGGVAAAGVAVVSATTITATTSAGTAGAGDVVVTVGGQSGRLTGGFTYQAPVAVTMAFTVYNHTGGPMGTFTQTAQSGDDVTLRIAALGVQPGMAATATIINVSGVDPNRIVVREAAQGGRIGNFVAFSKNGQVTFKAPLANASYDVFLINGRTSVPEYDQMDPPCHYINCYGLEKWGSLIQPRTVEVALASRNGAVVYESGVDEVLVQFDAALTLAGMRYGSISRQPGVQPTTSYKDLPVIVGKVWVEFGGSDTFGGSHVGFSSGGHWIGLGVPKLIELRRDYRGVLIEELFELLTEVTDVNPYRTGCNEWGWCGSDHIRTGDRYLNNTGRDLLAYVYVKDKKGW